MGGDGEQIPVPLESSSHSGVGSVSGDGEQIPVPFVLMRGGTSKAVFLRAEVLPPPGKARDQLILSLFGSPDPRQIDGLGGADLLTSKLAIIGPPGRADADLDYTFAQVSITEPVVDYDINCGNISAAVAAYAVDEGLVDRSADWGDVARVRIHNTNTGRILGAEVPLRHGRSAVEGPCRVHGVPGAGAPISLDFSATAGGITGSLFPTGNVRDTLATSLGPVEATIMDLANLTVFFPASAVDMTGAESPGEFTPEMLGAVSAVKEAASLLMDLDPEGLIPVPALVAPPAPFVDYGTGATVDAGQVDFLARVVGGRPPVPHKAYPGTLAACTGVAARIPGTVVAQSLVADPGLDDEIRIGHPSGVMAVGARVHLGPQGWIPDRATYLRTARRLAEGTAFVRTAVL
ncbi:MAG TPA: 3-methylitaconate isomerase [Acidimicrobiales bacterium]|nr:3-methylitaconate isomerase [Acidimicrobiales bacterium]